MKSILLFVVCLSLIFSAHSQTITFTIDPNRKAQVIDNIGASGCWFSEGIGRFWPAEKKERIAELLFSRKADSNGNPLGIGLSAWRFNIGGGSAEQGDSSGISNPVKRVECFLSADGTYNWNKQAGYQWFVRKAKDYGVENLIAFSNTPPVQFTRNGLGFRTVKDYTANLRDDRYGAYAAFLAEVLRHFDREGLHFKYISPVNEPQWDWSNAFGKMNQEGSPWHNEDIYHIAGSLDSVLKKDGLTTKILLAEAGTLTHLYKGTGPAAEQMKYFFSKTDPHYAGNLTTVAPVIAGHSYFTDAGDTAIVTVRSMVRDTAARYQVAFWQSEYSMLGNGYKEGGKGRTSAMDCALFLAKIIYHDIAVAHASAWQFWNSYEPGNPDFETRYYLMALKSNPDNTSGDFTVTKNLWALGHYSLFIRPGMQCLQVTRSDGFDDIKAAQDVMLSAFTGNKRLVVVVINYTASERNISLLLPGIKRFRQMKQYVTTADKENNMKPCLLPSIQNIRLAPRSIATLVLEK